MGFCEPVGFERCGAGRAARSVTSDRHPVVPYWCPAGVGRGPRSVAHPEEAVETALRPASRPPGRPAWWATAERSRVNGAKSSTNQVRERQ
jgi:hypothetical protein